MTMQSWTSAQIMRHAAAPLSVPAGRPRRSSASRASDRAALKNVTINEPFFQGHFPGYPVMPGVLIIEALAQVAAILRLPDARSASRATSR